MEALRITAKTLETLPESSGAIAQVETRIRSLTTAIRAIEEGIANIQRQLGEMQDGFNSSVIEQVASRVEKDGEATRERIEEVIDCLKHDKSSAWINTELGSEREPAFYEETAQPPFMLWSLDESPQGRLKPMARFNGLEVSATASTESIENILGKRHLAEEFEHNLSRIKKRRLKDVTPYVSLAKRGQHFQILREYLPPTLVEKFGKNIPQELLKEALSVTRRLGQEYRYYLLDRILNDQCYTLPKLQVMEELERGILAIHAGKLNVELGFGIDRMKEHDITQYRYDVRVSFMKKRSELYK